MAAPIVSHARFYVVGRGTGISHSSGSSISKALMPESRLTFPTWANFAHHAQVPHPSVFAVFGVADFSDARRRCVSERTGGRDSDEL